MRSGTTTYFLYLIVKEKWQVNLIINNEAVSME